MPAEAFANGCDIGAHSWSPHALLDRFATTGAGGNLPVGMKAEQLAARKYRLGFFGRARDQILHQHLTGERVARVEFLQRLR